MRVDLVRTPAGNFERIRSSLRALGADVREVPPSRIGPGRGPIVLAGVSSFSTIGRALRPARRAWEGLGTDGRPVLGICAGLQALFESSEEGAGRGVGLLEGRITRLRDRRQPHLGWSRLAPVGRSRLTEGLPTGSYAYFAHSYRVPDGVPGEAARTEYRGESFPSAVADGPLWGVQFHPELSGSVGRRVLTNFLEFAEGAGR